LTYDPSGTKLVSLDTQVKLDQQQLIAAEHRGPSLLRAAAGGDMASRIQAFINHPAGPKTIHFWAPTFKWAISLANLADLQRPPENVSYPQQIAVTATGLIWSRFSTQITPVREDDEC